jgi:predicted transcriptional regulator
MPAALKQQVAVAQRRQEVARLYVSGMSQYEIADELQVTQPTISTDLKSIQEMWRERNVAFLSAHKLLELARIDEVERNAWEAWNRSQQDAVETSGDLDDQKKMANVHIKRKGQAGAAKFLDIVLGCIDRRCKLLGLDAPIKIAETDVDGNDVTPDERMQRARELVAKYGLGSRPSIN